MKLKLKNEAPLVVDLSRALDNKNVVVCTLENGEKFGCYVADHFTKDEDGELDPLFLDDKNRIHSDYELFKARNTGLMWLREVKAERGYRW